MAIDGLRMPLFDVLWQQSPPGILLYIHYTPAIGIITDSDSQLVAVGLTLYDAMVVHEW